MPEKANHCRQARCRDCGWDRKGLAARNKKIATQGLARCGGIEYLALPKKENTDEKEQ